MTDWFKELEDRLPTLGHRNWLAIVDMAFPDLVAPGIVKIWTNADLLRVLSDCLRLIQRFPHIKPILWLDRELDFVREEEAPGISQYRENLKVTLEKLPVKQENHEDIIKRLDEAGRTFTVVLLKTRTCLPYSSVFVELECGYWDKTRESHLRERLVSP
ncbi:MAG: hypothetical protein NZ959_03945 [Armatimonadetes bacterium]|nr:hypothetical protein [Armatimonadota bacterium]